MSRTHATLLALGLAVAVAGCASTAATDTTQAAPKADASLDAAIAGSWRSTENSARDRFRHPRETLAFFGVAPNQTVIEITPGAGWYTEIFAPYLSANGHYIGATPAAAADSAGGKRNTALRERLASEPAFAGGSLLEVDSKAPVFGPANSADAILTFRNVHNWVAAGTTDAYFQAFFKALKPGGVLGVVDHRAKPGTELEKMKSSGYLTEALVIEHATRAGFVLEARSEVNANAKDDTDHPNGVWTLPPVNRHDAKDDAMYKAIGESDRMTLRFRKPR